MKDVFIAAYDLHSCLGEGISEAIHTLKQGAIEPSKVDLPEGQSRPYYLLRNAPEQKIQNLSTVAWQKRTLHAVQSVTCLLYTYPSPRDRTRSRMPSSA